jgi:4-nitrophenyl phosphatase
MLDQLRPPIRGLIVDMDGVLWKDATPIGDLHAISECIKVRGLELILATNNATATVAEYVSKLHGFGMQLGPSQIVTSADAVADTLGARFPRRGSVFVVGEHGLVEALTQQGFLVITDPADETEVVAIVAGFDRSLTYQKLVRATLHVRAGVPFYGTNSDATFPTPAGLVPGAGAILAAIATASNVQPIVVGKPAPFMLQLSARRMDLQPSEVLVVGDRLETDIAGGKAFGARTALVLSGVSTKAEAEAWQPGPDLVSPDLAELVGA